jgi:hypothetical protein
MRSKAINVGQQTYNLVFLMSAEDALEAANMYFQDDKAKATLVSELGGNPPVKKGSCYPHRRLIFVALAGAKQEVIKCVLHEISHAWLFELGCDWQNETLTETLATGFLNIRNAYFSDLILLN